MEGYPSRSVSGVFTNYIRAGNYTNLNLSAYALNHR